MAHVQTVLGPIEPADARVHPAARAHPDRAVAHPEPLGLLAADPRRAGHPRRAGAVPRGRRERPRRPDAAGRRARPGLAAAASPRRAACTSSWAAAGIGRPTTRPRRASTGGRWTTSPTSWSARSTDGVGDTGIRPGIIGEIGTDKPWVSPAEERVHRAAARAARRTGLAITTHAVLSDVGLAQLRIFEEEGADPARVVIGHADSYPVLDHYLAIVERGANRRVRLPRDALAPAERHGEARMVELALRAAGARPRRSRSCSARTSATTRSSSATAGNGYAYLAETFLPRLRAAGVVRRRDRDDDGREPAAAPDDRLDRRSR